MSRRHQIAILSDIHYAGAAEQARGNDFEFRGLKNPLLRFAVRAHRRFVWLRYPLNQNHLLDEFIRRAGTPDLVVANGDYSCNSAFVGLSDDAAFESARECLEKLRAKFAPNFQATIGDHELGKISFVGGRGGMRLASWRHATRELGLQPLWRVELGNYVLIGVASSMVALPVFEPDTLAEERAEWREIRERHLAEIRETFATLKPDQRVLLFCHDPTALPFLWREEAVRGKIQQIEQTIIGHLHSPLVLWQARLMAGMPPVNFFGHTAKRLSAALREARHWRPFKLRLCPSLAGIELLKDGGYYTAELDGEGREPVKFEFHAIKR